MTKPFLEIKGIKKQYGPVVAVQNVDLQVERGEFLTFLGPSGSGKSTTLYIVAGFEDPTAGDILLDGKSILSTPSHKRNIGMVFQRYTLFPHLSVGENIAFPLKVRRLPKATIDAKVKEMLRLVRLEGFEDRKPAQMSGGQQQRVALARALAYDPPILLMDEPLSALDKKLREQIQHEIRRIHQQTEVTILYVTHDQEEALRLSDRIAVFSKGVIDQIGTGPELYADPRTRFVAEFIGDSDFISCDLITASAGQATISLGNGAVFDQIPVHGTAVAGCRASLMLRPERIRIYRDHAGSNGLAATISDITFLGNNIHVMTETASGEKLAVRLPFGNEAITGLRRGELIRLDFDANAARVFC